MEHTPALLIEGLSFRYEGTAPDAGGASSYSLDIPRFELAKGEQVLLTGGSGSGKSTLLQLIAGLMDPNNGKVLVAGTNVHALHGAKRDAFRGRSIGMIFQTFNLLLGFSAAENVMAALMFSSIPAAEHPGKAKSLLDRLGITRHNARVEHMSVGQQQRVAVARALACGPALVLADEPTASLDPENSDAAMAMIQSACRESGAALLCVSHDPSIKSRFERIDSLAGLKAGAKEVAR
ncbi:MAG: ABC transporter ATP-binding protein [Phycisphaerales bacterium]